MKTKLYLFIFMFFSLNKILGQNHIVKWSRTIKDSLPNDFSFIGKEPSSKNSFWLIREDQTNYLIKLDSNNQKIFYKKLELIDNSIPNKNNTSVSILNKTICKDRIAIFTINCQDKKSNCGIFVSEFSFNGLQINSNKKIFELKPGDSFKFNFAISPDSSKIILSANLPPQQGHKKNVFYIKIYDSKFNFLNSQDIELSIDQDLDINKIELEEIILTNESKVYILGKKLNKRNQLLKYGIWALNPLNNYIKEIEFQIDNYQIENTLCRINALGEIIISGFYYKNKGRESEIRPYDGVFFGNINKENNSIENIKLTEIPKGTEHLPTKGFMIRKNLTFIMKEDGGVIMMIESMFNPHKSEHLGNILIVNLNHDGSVKYSVAVLKNHYVYILAYFVEYSFVPMYDNLAKKLFIFYNDNPANLTNNGNAIPMIYPKRSIPIAVSLDTDGNIIKEKLNSDSAEAIILCPGLSKQFDIKQIYLVGLQEKKLKVGKLTLD